MHYEQVSCFVQASEIQTNAGWEDVNINYGMSGSRKDVDGRMEGRSERERDLYLSVVTGTHYGTKTPPDQQPTKLCAGV